MKISQAVSQTDELKHNTYTYADKVRWLSRMDWMVKRHIIDIHEGGEDTAFTGYEETTDPDTELLVPEPYDQVYLRWLEAQIDYHNGEYGRYNNAIEMFNTEFNAYKNYYTRTHTPKGCKFNYF